jgi:hypothetical protein
MTKLQDSDVFFADISAIPIRHARFITFVGQEKETQHLLSDYVLNTIEEIQGFMDLVEKHLRESIILQRNSF